MKLTNRGLIVASLSLGVGALLGLHLLAIIIVKIGELL